VRYDGTNWSELTDFPRDGNPGDPTKTLHHVWGRSGNEVYAAASGGVLKYDGEEWDSVGGSWFAALWCDAGSDLFAIRTETHSEGGGGIGDWGDPEDIWCVGKIYSYNGTEWTAIETATDMAFNGIWGDTDTGLFVVGCKREYYLDDDGPIIGFNNVENPRIFHRDGGSLDQVYGPAAEGALNDIWGMADTVAYAVGSGGLIVHFDGSSWNEMSSPTNVSLLAVWGSAATHVFAVGYDGTILQCDGENWTLVQSGTGELLYDVWGSSEGDAFAVGGNGTIVHYNGGRWEPMASPTANDLYAIWGSAPDDIFAVGKFGTILHCEYR
jgi:hypothetical protein